MKNKIYISWNLSVFTFLTAEETRSLGFVKQLYFVLWGFLPACSASMKQESAFCLWKCTAFFFPTSWSLNEIMIGEVRNKDVKSQAQKSAHLEWRTKQCECAPTNAFPDAWIYQKGEIEAGSWCPSKSTGHCSLRSSYGNHWRFRCLALSPPWPRGLTLWMFFVALPSHHAVWSLVPSKCPQLSQKCEKGIYFCSTGF